MSRLRPQKKRLWQQIYIIRSRHSSVDLCLAWSRMQPTLVGHHYRPGTTAVGPVFLYKLRYIVGFGLVEMAISTNPKPAIYRNLYENTARTGRGGGSTADKRCTINNRIWPTIKQMMEHFLSTGARVLRRLRIGPDGHLDQSEACDIS